MPLISQSDLRQYEFGGWFLVVGLCVIVFGSLTHTVGGLTVKSEEMGVWGWKAIAFVIRSQTSNSMSLGDGFDL